MPRIRGKRQRKKKTPSRVGGLGSKAKPRSRSLRRSSGKSTPKPMKRQRSRIRRPMRRRRTHHGGIGYPRRYRRRPMSSCGCFAFFIILAIIWLIFLAPPIVISLDATLAFVLPIVVVLGLFIIALWFITRIVDDDDDNGGQTTVIERERVLVICPYCGTKNEQGITTCTNCGGDI
ncbi:MAG: zinc ribbon domain-containing protein [Candidatus Thorarchaeota archaeon]